MSVLVPDVVNSSQASQVVNQVKHFFISFIIVKWDDGDSIVYLECETINGVVYDNNIFQVSVSKNSQVFDVIPLLSQEAVLSVQPCLEILFLWVDIIKDSISVNLMGGCKYNNLEMFVSFFKALHDVRPDIDPRVNYLFIWKIDF